MTRSRIVAAGAVLAVALTATLYVLARPSGTRLTAYFGQAVGVYTGSDLRVLGVRIGKVESVRPEGRQVRVTMSIDHGVDVPADAVAVVVAPSVVADRYIQLSPAYTGGPRLADHAVIPVTRTATPVELDQLYASISRLATALGPNGANRKGALSDLLDVGARDLGGNGNRVRGWARAARAFPHDARNDLLDRYAEIGVPTLLLWADADERHPLSIAEEALDLLPDAQLRILPRTGFLIAYDDPVGVARELAAFCG